ncbi:S1 family peptidase [Stenotrophomonas sp. PD6]|uniref:S1 family peptidase n=1 Tax=Stenotrophomonas sp. PD6 TaxID=3368612 RepID=UPI003B9E524D
MIARFIPAFVNGFKTMPTNAIPERTLVQQLDQCTVRIESNSGAVGTGFFFAVGPDGGPPVEGKPFSPLVITNKHVIDGATSIKFVLSARNPMGQVQHVPFEFPASALDITTHPKGIDLAAFKIVGALTSLQQQSLAAEMTWLDGSIIPSTETFAELPPLSDVVLVGYPTGLWDHINNRPIFRRGITATTPHVRWQGRDEFLIDAAIFGGSSGSPVFVYNEGSYASRGGIVVGTRLLLIGVNQAVYVHHTTGRLEAIPAPSDFSVQPVTGIPNNLGIAIAANQIKSLVDAALAPKGWQPYQLAGISFNAAKST